MPVMPSPAIEFLGILTRFGMLEFLSETEPRTIERKDGQRRVRMGLFRCDCGQTTVADLRNVRRGRTRSCGCHVGRRFDGQCSVRAAGGVQSNSG